MNALERHPYRKSSAVQTRFSDRVRFVFQAKPCRNCIPLGKWRAASPTLDSVAVRLTEDQLIRQ